MLEVTAINFEYPERSVLSRVSFSVERGSLLHLRGMNGAGKTTLLKLLAGILPVQDGTIQFQGKNISDDLACYQQQICFLGHKSGISSLLTPLENCRFDLSRNEIFSSLNQLLKQFSLQHVADIPCGLLSAGQKRRVALMRLAMSQATIWLLDEPMVALDREGTTLLMDMIGEHLKQGGMVILSSHQTIPNLGKAYQEYCL
ncbi:cytochrome c biogenesis heme-transporting ATPase CcmA [Legionella londiniensis]|uniref:Heme exporter protein CcmA n=1 Tax=Legionella londiniensis TaxID=45068 RepID=A0A0W0VM16_9GAMM|nr:cytochrome c biogenesis heme-transporting ATPase CcmA [Legionella londiniensis]KTD21195.1 heme exporter protein CcmA [Legionella londiniensis]STX93220.1 heme exporter protein CcmA [Legionella londiniensis]